MFLGILFAISLIISIGVFTGCQKIETSELEATTGMFTYIDITDIPKNVTPIYCESQEQTNNLIKNMLTKRTLSDTEMETHLGEIPIIQFPLLKTKAESYDRIDPDYWWHQHLDIYFTYDYVGGADNST